MKIERVHVEDFLGIRSVSLALDNQLTGVFGPNGSGKSSLRDAISFCAFGEIARVPKMKKKDYSDLLHPGAKRGHATLTIDGVTFSRGVPSGNFSTRSLEPQRGWEYLLDTGAFLRLSFDERRKALFRALGIAMDVGSIERRLVEPRRHADDPLAARPYYDDKYVSRIRSFLRQGFEIAATEAALIAREVKGRWRQITGEDWGANKAAKWFAAVDTEGGGTDTDLARLRLAVAKYEGQLAGIDGQIGVARREEAVAGQRAWQARQRREQAERAREEAERGGRRIAELRNNLVGEGAARAEHETAVLGVEEAERAWEEAQAVVPPGAYTYTCGSCGRTTILVPDPAMDATADGPASLVEPADDERADLRVNVVQAKRVLADAARALDRFARGRALLEELEAMQLAPPEPEPEPESEPEPTTSDDLAALEVHRQTLARQLTEAREAVRRVEDHQARVAGAKQRTDEAAALHVEIETWLRLAKDLGPEGIPAQLLHDAIDPINERLAQSGEALGFVSLALTPEMDLVGRPQENDPETPRRFELLSESARWRAEAALGDAIGGCLEGSKASPLPLVLDRFDVCDAANRGRVIRWLRSLDRQSIVLGTLRVRDVPEPLPAGMSVCWLESGRVVGT